MKENNAYKKPLNERKRKRTGNKTGEMLVAIVLMLALMCVIFMGLILSSKVDRLLKVTDELLKVVSEQSFGTTDTLIDTEENNATIAAQSLLSASERDLIERVVASEARGEEYKGKIAVAQTIKDRGDLWGMTYTEVVKAPNQYAPPYKGEVSEEVKQAVSEVFDYGARAFEEPTTHFHAEGVNPSWASEKVSRGMIGRHRFYY